MHTIDIQQFSALSENLLKDLVHLETQIFETPLGDNDFLAELDGKKNLLILVVVEGLLPCAYKIGFEFSSHTFFSWSGGVLPTHRKRGLARMLMTQQHQVAKGMGYSSVRTHTKNKYRDMLIMNIKAGFDVTGIYKSLHEAHQGIILEKML